MSCTIKNHSKPQEQKKKAKLFFYNWKQNIQNIIKTQSEPPHPHLKLTLSPM